MCIPSSLPRPPITVQAATELCWLTCACSRLNGDELARAGGLRLLARLLMRCIAGAARASASGVRCGGLHRLLHLATSRLNGRRGLHLRSRKLYSCPVSPPLRAPTLLQSCRATCMLWTLPL